MHLKWLAPLSRANGFGAPNFLDRLVTTNASVIASVRVNSGSPTYAATATQRYGGWQVGVYRFRTGSVAEQGLAVYPANSSELLMRSRVYKNLS